MALLHMDGFDRYATLADAVQYGAYTVSGGWSVQTTGSAWGGGIVLPANSGSA